MDPSRSRCFFFWGAVGVAYGAKKLVTYENHVNMQKVKEYNPPTDYSHKVAKKLK